MKKLIFMLAVTAMFAIASCNNAAKTETTPTADSTAQVDTVILATDTTAVK